MATAPAVLPRSSRMRAKYLLFGFVGLMLVYVLQTQRELPHPSEGPGLATLSVVQVVAVTTWDRRSVRPAAGANAILGTAAAAFHETASHRGANLCCRRVRGWGA